MRGKITKWIIIGAVLLIAVMVIGGVVMYVRKDTSDIDITGITVTRTSGTCVLVGVKGTYLSETKDEIINRINEIRKEACDEGISFNGVALTAKDYKPLKWSSDLELIAQLRAAEATVNEYHTRPNGTNYSAVTHNSISSEAEVLAWGEGILQSVEQWYAQKDALVNNTGEETRYYLEMINPNYTYVGLGSFMTAEGSEVATAGEFLSSSEKLSGKKSKLSGEVTQIIEVRAASLSDLYVSGKTDIVVGETAHFTFKADTTNKDTYGEELTLPVIIVDGPEWLSEDTTIASVDQKGNVTGVGAGTVEVSVEVGNTTLIMEIVVRNVAKETIEYSEVLKHIEAEDFISQSGGVEVSSEQYDGATVISSIVKGDTITYDVEMLESADCILNIRASLQYEGAESIDIYINDLYAGWMTIGSTGSWTTFDVFKSDVISLGTGRHKITLEAVTGGSYLVDWIEIAGAGEEDSTEETATVSEDVEDTEGKLVLKGNKYGEGSMIGTYTPPLSDGEATDEYKFLGYVSFLDKVPDTFIEEGNYRYLVMTYTGDITQLRVDFERSYEIGIELQGSFWFNPEGHDSYFVTADGSDIPLVGDNTTIVIDLLNSVHPDNGVDVAGVDLSWYNTGMRMYCDMMATYGNGAGIEITDAYLTNMIPE